MSNARVRKYLEGVSAPLMAWLIDHQYVADDCGILNGSNYHLREGILVGSRMLQGQVQVPVPDIRSAADRHHTPRERL